jgi:hypothetical protein
MNAMQISWNTQYFWTCRGLFTHGRKKHQFHFKRFVDAILTRLRIINPGTDHVNCGLYPIEQLFDMPTYHVGFFQLILLIHGFLDTVTLTTNNYRVRVKYPPTCISHYLKRNKNNISLRLGFDDICNSIFKKCGGKSTYE